MSWFRRTPPERPYTLAEYLDEVTGAIQSEVNLFPNAAWLRSYNERIETEEEKTGKLELLALPPTPLEFSEDQPGVFYEHESGKPYRGQEAAKQLIDINIGALRCGERFKCLLTGPAGSGKTTLAWIVAKRLQKRQAELQISPGRFFEILPNQVDTKAVLDNFMQQLVSGDIVFIDEIHVLREMLGVEILYNVLADGGQARYPLSNGRGWVTLPADVHWITATTEPGELDRTNGGALNRRLQPEVELQEPSNEDLVRILQDQQMLIHPDAAYEIVERSGALPWQALLVYGQARSVARYHNIEQILPPHAAKAFEMLGLDSNGLLPRDRRVLQVLLGVKHVQAYGRVVYKMSEAALIAASGVDRATYKERMQPKLMRLGYLTTVGGQALTEKALSDYAHLATER